MPEPGAGPSLSDLGRKQAEEAAQYILGWRPSLPPLVAVYSSPLCRARETAGIIGQALDLGVVENPALADCNAGEWAGVALSQLAKKPEWATVQHYPSGFRFPGGESMPEMSTRLVGAVKAVVQAHPGQAVVVVSHADPIKAVLAEALGTHLDLFQRIGVSPASVSAVSYAEAGPNVVLTNWTGPSGHAPPKAAVAAGTAAGSRL
jgi:broad specificity phosphatase PhoE